MKRITAKKAAELLDMSSAAVRELAHCGKLKAVTNSVACGRGVRMYFDELEVFAFASGGPLAAKAYRESLADDKPSPRRGRRKTATA